MDIKTKIVGFVYARLDSTRFPNKALSKIGDKRLIDIVMDRAKSTNLDKIVLLTSDRVCDDHLANSVTERGYEVIRGSASDVVDRTVYALECTGADIFARINGDSPLQDKNLINFAIKHAKLDRLTSNVFVRKYPYGISAELIGKTIYHKYHQKCFESELEHVTKHLYRLVEDSEKISIEGSVNQADYECTVDTVDQLTKLQRLMKYSAWDVNYNTILQLNENKPVVKYYDV